MKSRPLCIFGAAFLLTASAALFAPLLLLLIALPAAFAVLFWLGKVPRGLYCFSLGCLAAMAASGFFFLRLHQSSALVGASMAYRGTVFYEGDRQLALITPEGGKQRLAAFLPPLEGAETGDSVSGTLEVRRAVTDGRHYLLSGGILLDCLSLSTTPAPEQKMPFFIQTLCRRQALCQKLLALSPSPAASVTAAVLFSYTDNLSPDLRQAFSQSGMGHLLAVSGLHLSIMVWCIMALVRRLGGGSLLQALGGGAAALLLFFAAGMSPSVFRAAVMALLTLTAGLIRRKSDGLTSLSMAAVVLVGLCPPILTDLSFQLSFAAVLGILTLTPRLAALGEQLCTARFSSCGGLTRGLINALAVSVGAQLATAPILAVTFGRLPVLGLVVNLIAIPLVYPVLIFGFAALLPLLAGLSRLTLLLLIPANLCSALLARIAVLTAGLPFCSLPMVFPLDFLPLPILSLGLGLLLLRPLRPRQQTVLCLLTLCAVVFTGAVNLTLTRNSVLVASSAVTGSLTLTYRGDTVLLDGTENAYHRRLDERRMELLGAAQPCALLLTHPYDAPRRTAAVTDHYCGLPPERVFSPKRLTQPVPLLPNVTACIAQPYVTEFTVGNTKLMKFYAFYDTIEPLKPSPQPYILADRQGNLLALGGKPFVFRRGNGDSFTRIYIK